MSFNVSITRVHEEIMYVGATISYGLSVCEAYVITTMNLDECEICVWDPWIDEWVYLRNIRRIARIPSTGHVYSGRTAGLTVTYGRAFIKVMHKMNRWQIQTRLLWLCFPFFIKTSLPRGSSCMEISRKNGAWPMENLVRKNYAFRKSLEEW